MWVDASIEKLGNTPLKIVPITPYQLAALTRGGDRSRRRTPRKRNTLETRTEMARVLVIDDHIDARVLLEDFLQNRGYYVAVAKNGAEALALLRGGIQFDLILLDLIMPEADGFSLIAGLRKLPAAVRKLPVIVLSGVAPRKLRGAKAVLSKPVSLDLLLEVVQRVLTDP